MTERELIERLRDALVTAHGEPSGCAPRCPFSYVIADADAYLAGTAASADDIMDRAGRDAILCEIEDEFDTLEDEYAVLVADRDRLAAQLAEARAVLAIVETRGPTIHRDSAACEQFTCPCCGAGAYNNTEWHAPGCSLRAALSTPTPPAPDPAAQEAEMQVPPATVSRAAPDAPSTHGRRDCAHHSSDRAPMEVYPVEWCATCRSFYCGPAGAPGGEEE